MFVHHVYFWLKNPENREEHTRLAEGIKSLQQIEPKISSHVGVPASTDRNVIDASYSFSLLMIFDNAADQELYQNHPIHNQFLAECAKLWSKVLVYDAVDG